MSHHHHIAPDPGLQPQRTALSWTRTASSMLVNAVICVRGAYVYESKPLSFLAATLLAASALAFWFARVRSSHLAMNLRSKMEVPHVAVLAMTAASSLAAVAGLLAIATNHNYLPHDLTSLTAFFGNSRSLR